MSGALLDAARLVAELAVPCVELTRFALARVYGITPSGPGSEWYRDLYIWDPERPWSPLEAAVRELGAEPVEAPRPGRWHLCQGWRLLTPDGRVPAPGPDVPDELGHAWLWWGLTRERGLALESSVERGVRLDRRPLVDENRELCGPGERWRDRCRNYPAGVRLVALPDPSPRKRSGA